jgi:hypothetical protein
VPSGHRFVAQRSEDPRDRDLHPQPPEGPKGPKSKAGKRELSIPPEIVDGIKYHLDNHVGPDADSPIFDCTPTELRGAWERARRSIGRRELHLHDLRGAGLTWAAIAGATTAELMYRAGHSTPTMVMRYQRATKDRDRALAQAMADLARPAAVVPIAPRDTGGTRMIFSWPAHPRSGLATLLTSTFLGCRRGDLDSYSTGPPGLLIGPDLCLPAA